MEEQPRENFRKHLREGNRTLKNPTHGNQGVSEMEEQYTRVNNIFEHPPQSQPSDIIKDLSLNLLELRN